MCFCWSGSIFWTETWSHDIIKQHAHVQHIKKCINDECAIREQFTWIMWRLEKWWVDGSSLTSCGGGWIKHLVKKSQTLYEEVCGLVLQELNVHHRCSHAETLKCPNWSFWCVRPGESLIKGINPLLITHVNISRSTAGDARSKLQGINEIIHRWHAGVMVIVCD